MENAQKLTAATVEMTAENFIFIEMEFFNEWNEMLVDAMINGDASG